MPTDRVLTIRVTPGDYVNDVWTWAPSQDYRVWASQLDPAGQTDEIELLERGVLSHLKRRWRVRWFAALMSGNLRTLEIYEVANNAKWNVIERIEVTNDGRQRRRWVDLICQRRGA